MIRAARFQDIDEIAAMLREMYAASKYQGRVEISEKAMQQLLMGLVAGQNQQGPQGSFVAVALHGGKVCGFMAGVLDRVEHIGNRLMASDIYLFVRPGARASHALQLIDAYISWASGNPKVLEIKLSWHDALPGAERMAVVYKRKGFELIGGIFEMRRDAPAQREAA